MRRGWSRPIFIVSRRSTSAGHGTTSMRRPRRCVRPDPDRGRSGRRRCGNDDPVGRERYGNRPSRSARSRDGRKSTSFAVTCSCSRPALGHAVQSFPVAPVADAGILGHIICSGQLLRNSSGVILRNSRSSTRATSAPNRPYGVGFFGARPGTGVRMAWSSFSAGACQVDFKGDDHVDDGTFR